MKKMISILLALVLLMSMSITVFAEDSNTSLNAAGSADVNVIGTYVAGETGGTVFSVDIAWTGMDFTYHAASESVWDATEHKYSDAVAAYWEGQGTITVTNHSNTAIDVTPAFTKADGIDGVGMTFSANPLKIISAADNNQEEVGTITVDPSGSLPANTNGTIGTIKVTIAENIGDKDITVEEAETLSTNMYNLAVAEGTASETNEFNTIRLGLVSKINMYKNDSSEANQKALNSAYQDALDAYNAALAA